MSNWKKNQVSKNYPNSCVSVTVECMLSDRFYDTISEEMDEFIAVTEPIRTRISTLQVPGSMDPYKRWQFITSNEFADKLFARLEEITNENN